MRRSPRHLLATLGAVPAIAATLAGCGAPARTDARGEPPAASAVRASEATQVIASRREVRVIFARDTATRWGWPASGSRHDPAGYVWSVAIDVVGGSENLVLHVDRMGGTARDFASLEEVVAAGHAAWCTPGMILTCLAPGVSASVEGGRVVVVLRDSARIAALFALRPPVVRSAQRTRGLPGGDRAETVRVQYVEPQIPEPDAALLAEDARRRRQAEVGEIRRSIDSDHGQGGGALWVAVGDSAEVNVQEFRCRIDLCAAQNSLVSDSGWQVADPGIARLADPAAAARRTRMRGGVRQYVVARRPGRTAVRVAGLRSPEDTVTGRPPAPRELAIDVVVTPPIERVELGALPDTVVVPTPVRTSVRVLDRAGRELRGAPVMLAADGGEWGVRSYSLADSVTVHLPGPPGRRMLVASFGGRADTAFVHVVAPPER